ITETDYFYNVVDENAQRKQLNNTVLAMDQNGSIQPMLLATDADIVTDARESKTTSHGASVDANAGGFWALFGVPFAGTYFSITAGNTSYNSIASVKVLHQYGMLRQVRTTQNGSTL